MRRIISVILSLSLLVTLFSSSALAKPGNGAGLGKSKKFSDINNHWGKESIVKLQDRGMFNGYEDGTFRPDNKITQSELAVLIGLYLEKESGIDSDDNDEIDEDKDLKDVPAWAKKAVNKGLKHKYINLKRFNSHVQCDRLLACVQLAKALDLEPVTVIIFNPFKDRVLIPDEDYGYILALYNAGYIKGYPDGNFNPNKLISRAEMASIIEKLLDNDDEESDDTPPIWPSDSELKASEVGVNQVSLRWTAAEDNKEVIGYKVTCKGNGEAKEKEVGLARTITIDGLEPNEEYKFTVEAKDAAGNWSEDGPSIRVTTEEESDNQADGEKPYWSEENLTVTNIKDTEVTLNWSGAKDNQGVEKYRIYVNNRLDLTVEGDIDSQEIVGLSPDTNYTFRVEAGDLAGNWSEDGPSIFAHTAID